MQNLTKKSKNNKKNKTKKNPKMSYRALKKFKPGSKNLKKSKNEIGEEKNDIRGRKKSKFG